MSLNTTPATWAAGEVPTATKMNTEIRDAVTGIQAAWVTYTPTVSNVAINGLVAKYHQVGKTVTVRGYFGLTASPTGAVTVSLPVNASLSWGTGLSQPLGVVSGLRQSVSWRIGLVVLNTTSTIGFMSDGSGGTMWANGAPVAWGANDNWGFTFTYEAA